jgi:hypothetical protein
LSALEQTPFKWGDLSVYSFLIISKRSNIAQLVIFTEIQEDREKIINLGMQ